MEKAEGTGDIVCNMKETKCPKHPDGHKYRGKHKCWSCDYATWYNTGLPYGRMH